MRASAATAAAALTPLLPRRRCCLDAAAVSTPLLPHCWRRRCQCCLMEEPLFLCGICLDEDKRGKIYQCDKGHGWCEDCYSRHVDEQRRRGESPSCPLCRDKLAKRPVRSRTCRAICSNGRPCRNQVHPNAGTDGHCPFTCGLHKHLRKLQLLCACIPCDGYRHRR